MKKIIVTIMLCLGFVSSVQAKDFSAGVEYNLLAQPQATDTGDKIEVLEFFWYGCPHCFRFEPLVKKWLDKKPDNVEFIRVPAVFRPSWKMHARTYYALQIMGLTEETHSKIFNAMHVKRLKLNSLDSMTDFLVKQNIDKKKFLGAYNSFAVENMIRKALKKLKNYKIEGVPAVAVNGKYLITGQTAGSYEKLIDVVNFLIKKESAVKIK